MKNKLNLLIIGGNGFIGSNLVKVLKYEHNVTVFDRSPNQLYEKLIEDLGLTYGAYFNNWNNQKKSIEEKSCAWKSSIII